MLYRLDMITTNSGDGSNTVEYSTDPRVLYLKHSLADQGDEKYASGDGLQHTSLDFLTKQARQDFIDLNCPYLHTMENRGDLW